MFLSSSKIGVLSKSQNCPTNRPLSLVLLRIGLSTRKEYNIVNIIDNRFSAFLPHVIDLSCSI